MAQYNSTISHQDYPGGIIKLNYHDGLGNNLFQYCFGRVLAEELKCIFFTNRQINGFEHDKSTNFVCENDLYNREKEISIGHQIGKKELFSNEKVYDFTKFSDFIDSLKANQERKLITINKGYFVYLPFYTKYIQDIKNKWLKITEKSEFNQNNSTIHENDLTIHIRSGDIWHKNYHQPHESYCGLPFSYYKNIIDNGEKRWNKIYVVTNEQDDPMVIKLKESYQASVISGLEIDDFKFIKDSKNIVLAVSTFSWFAAFLSQAKKIYYPLAGIFHHEIRSDICLCVNEPRYHYQNIYQDEEYKKKWEGVFFPGSPSWKGSTEDEEFLLNH